jgi:hypothetical protein
MQQDPIAVLHAASGERSGDRLDAGVELGPGPGGVTPDQSGTVREAPRRLDQQMRQIGGWDQRNGSRMDT